MAGYENMAAFRLGLGPDMISGATLITALCIASNADERVKTVIKIHENALPAAFPLRKSKFFWGEAPHLRPLPIGARPTQPRERPPLQIVHTPMSWSNFRMCSIGKWKSDFRTSQQRELVEMQLSALRRVQ